ncbi:MAG: acetyl-CoA carboxylase biotin carboxyl carrier protein [Streptococcus sp.]|uniref:Biotin carboxyl carrier protein of acetyl-CoA carboxylase n=1 Tax=Streptococcus infantis TaxID=68892 RepID=A0A0F3HD63_9STRE|nr:MULTISPECIES: acetyl-CoA carboxylase biotin carboxyl carrier protein [Streptococcus]KJU90868.1 acetyl-CoA carboxylase biotin carboxyl carrier protein subunit [Streptococcus infantis]MDU2588025.1 acetyl-CoA carboxylase biotin carboxyl carrier protein [Streptococcus sp.]
MNLNEIKDLMAQFDQSSLREFSYKNGTDELLFSKNEAKLVVEASPAPQPVVPATAPQDPTSTPAVEAVSESNVIESVAEGDLVESPLVGVAYLAAGPDKPNFVSVGDTVKKGQTLVIIEAMKVMNEIPAPKDGVVTEILVENEEMVEFGKGLVRIK